MHRAHRRTFLLPFFIGVFGLVLAVDCAHARSEKPLKSYFRDIRQDAERYSQNALNEGLSPFAIKINETYGAGAFNGISVFLTGQEVAALKILQYIDLPIDSMEDGYRSEFGKSLSSNDLMRLIRFYLLRKHDELTARKYLKLYCELYNCYGSEERLLAWYPLLDEPSKTQSDLLRDTNLYRVGIVSILKGNPLYVITHLESLLPYASALDAAVLFTENSDGQFLFEDKRINLKDDALKVIGSLRKSLVDPEQAFKDLSTVTDERFLSPAQYAKIFIIERNPKLFSPAKIKETVSSMNLMEDEQRKITFHILAERGDTKEASEVVCATNHFRKNEEFAEKTKENYPKIHERILSDCPFNVVRNPIDEKKMIERLLPLLLKDPDFGHMGKASALWDYFQLDPTNKMVAAAYFVYRTAGEKAANGPDVDILETAFSKFVQASDPKSIEQAILASKMIEFGDALTLVNAGGASDAKSRKPSSVDSLLKAAQGEIGFSLNQEPARVFKEVAEEKQKPSEAIAGPTKSKSGFAAVGAIGTRDSYGTGVQVDKCHVLTAAHVVDRNDRTVYFPDDGLHAAEDAAGVIGDIVAIGNYASRGTGSPLVLQEDWAVIKLRESVKQTRYFELRKTNQKDVRALNLSSVGFAGGEIIRSENCELLKVDQAGFGYHNCTAKPGVSGGPIFYRSGKDQVLMGLHSRVGPRKPTSINDANSMTLIDGSDDIFSRNPLTEIKRAIKLFGCDKD